MAIRYCGNVKISITYRDDGTYKGYVSCGGVKWKYTDLQAPRCGLRVASDSPEAYDTMAESAIGFATHSEEGNPDFLSSSDADEISNNAEQDERGEYLIRRVDCSQGYRLQNRDFYRKGFEGSEGLFLACWRQYRQWLNGSIDDPKDDGDVMQWLEQIASEKVNDPRSPFYITG